MSRAWCDTRTIVGKPLISMVIATYEQWDELSCLLYSLRAQEWKHWEAIVVHDGPASVAKIEHPADSRIRYVQTEIRKQGWGHPWRQFGLDMAVGDFVCMSNGDNYYAPVFFEWMIHAAQATPADFVYCDMVHSHRRYDVLRTKPSSGSIDLGAWIGTSRIVKATPWLDMSFEGDGAYIEELVSKANGVVHVPGCLFVHN